MNATSSKLRGGVEEKQENCPSWIRGTRSKATEGVGKDIKKSDSSGMNATSSKPKGGVENKHLYFIESRTFVFPQKFLIFNFR